MQRFSEMKTNTEKGFFIAKQTEFKFSKANKSFRFGLKKMARFLLL